MQVTDNRLSSIRTHFEHALRNADYENNELRSVFKILCEDLLGLSSSQIALAKDTKLTESEILKLIQGIKELKKGRPIQYVTGKVQFCDLELNIDERALIPRPETEELVHWIISHEKSPQHILDIGTGSGCIALALKSHFHDSEVSAMDTHRDALDLARSNATSSGSNIQFIQDSILEISQDYQVFDIIVSNPPYVLNSERGDMRNNVLEHEPHSALFVEDNEPFIFYQAILDFAKNHLRKRGSVYLEINEQYGESMIELANERGFVDVELRKDLYGKDRMLRMQSEGIED